MPAQRLQLHRPAGTGGRGPRAVLPRAALALAALTLMAPALLARPAGRADAAGSAGPRLAWSTPRPAASPPPLAYAAAAYDPYTASVVVFGGRLPDGTLSDTTWVWDGSTWKSFPKAGPPAREMASMAFDPISPSMSQLILFGGQDQSGKLLDDTWAWNGYTWSVPTSQNRPPAREGAALSYAGDGQLVLFGGTGYAPQAAPTAGGTSDQPGSDETALSDTWTWTAQGWSPANVSVAPPMRSGATLSYSGSRTGAVLFGGEATPASSALPRVLSDTWTWSGSAWTRAKPAASPPGRYGAVSDYLAAAGGPVVTGGAGTGGGDLADTWAWTGSTWVRATVTGSPPPRAGAAGATDTPTGDLVVYGGTGGGGATLGDTGRLGAAPPATPPTTARPPATTTTVAPHPVPTRGTPPARHATSPPTTVHRPVPPATSHPAVTAAPKATPTGPLVLETSLQTVRRGHPFRVSGGGFSPGSVVTISFHSAGTVLGQATADQQGWFTRAVSVPAGATPGLHHVEARGTGADRKPAVLTASVYVLAPAAHKGTAVATALALVILAVLIPVATYLAMAGAGVWRRRRSAGN